MKRTAKKRSPTPLSVMTDNRPMRWRGGQHVSIEVVERKHARPLRKVEIRDDVWTLAVPRDAIVWLHASPEISAETIEVARQALMVQGAAAVRVQPQGPSDDVLPKVAEAKAKQTIREVVRELGQQAKTADRGALLRVLDEALSEAGL